MLQGETHRFTITDLNNEGEGIVRVGGERFVLFVPDALPGEDVTCRLVQVKKNYGTAKVLERHSQSPDRTTPRCPHFGQCGGCQLQHMTYGAQLAMKTRAVRDAISRIGGIANPPVEECAASPAQWGYRNKVAVPVQRNTREKFTAGFYKPRSHDIIHLKECKVLLPGLEKKLLEIIDLLREMDFSGYNDGKENKVINFIRHIVLREGKFSQESLCGVVGTKKLSDSERKLLATQIQEKIPALNGLIYNKNDSTGNFIWGEQFEQVYGAAEMEEYLGAYKFRFEISSFFQINSQQTINLYKKTAELALANSPKRILELYSGVGSLTAFLAAGAERVTAVESWKPAAEYISVNTERNGQSNVEVYSGKAEEVISELSGNRYETVVLDPPRTGCAQEVTDAMLKIEPERIVYVSCAPATLARDIKLLTQEKYILKTALPYDMFAQTGHVETIAMLERKK